MKIINIVILFKNSDEVCKYAEELAKQSQKDNIGLIIVVNDWGGSNYNEVNEKLSHIQINSAIVEAGENIGYFNGFIHGVNYFYSRNNECPDWFVLSNTDIEYRQPNFYDGFINEKYSHDSWCVGPSIYNGFTGTYQNPEADNRRKKYKVGLLTFIFRHKNLARAYIYMSKIKRSKSANKKPTSRYVYEIHGTYFAFRNDFVEKLKGKRFGAFLYSEEAFVAEELLKEGKKTYYDSDIEIIHHEHSVTGRISVDKKAHYLAESMRFIFEEYYKK